jgi:hypothetical protein
VLTGALAASGAGTPEADVSPTSRRARAVVDLALYVEWPANAFAEPRSPFVIGVLGADPFAGALDQEVRGRRAHGRSIVVRRYRNLDEYEPSHVLFVSESKARLIGVIREFLDSLDRRAVLTVGEPEDFARRGGLVRLIERPDGIDFEIDADGAGRVGLAIGSELLELAEPPPPPPPVGPGASRR